jgi:hypothetical protein
MVHSNIPDDHLVKFRAFRRAARKVFEAYKPTHGSVLQLNIGSDTAQMLTDAEFIRLLAAVRLVYMQKEPSSFGRVRGLLHKYGDETIQRRAAKVKDMWHDALAHGYDFVLHPRGSRGDLRSPDSAIVVSQEDLPPGAADSYQYNPQAVLDTWLNAEVFHQDEDRLADLERLESFGTAPVIFLQSTAIRLARAVLALDIILADFLGEDQLPYSEIFGEEVDHTDPYAGEEI